MQYSEGAQRKQTDGKKKKKKTAALQVRVVESNCKCSVRDEPLHESRKKSGDIVINTAAVPSSSLITLPSLSVLSQVSKTQRSSFFFVVVVCQEISKVKRKKSLNIKQR